MVTYVHGEQEQLFERIWTLKMAVIRCHSTVSKTQSLKGRIKPANTFPLDCRLFKGKNCICVSLNPAVISCSAHLLSGICWEPLWNGEIVSNVISKVRQSPYFLKHYFMGLQHFFDYFVCVCVFSLVCVPCEFLVPMEFRGGCWSP